MRNISMLDFLTLLSALGCGLIAGTFFAFSTFVMKALAKLPAPQGIAAMQSINVVVVNPWFMTAFVGTAGLSALAIIGALLRWRDPGVAYLVAGSVLYLVGSFLVTMLFNVPRNDALARVAPTSAEGASLWVAYLSTWTAWNHVRGAAAFAAMTSFILALRVR